MEDLVPYLQRISSSAKDIVRIAHSRGIRATLPSQPTTISFTGLPCPAFHEIRSRLEQAGLPRKAVNDTIAVYQDACSRWRRDLEQAFNQAAVTISPHNLHLFDALRTRMYIQQIQKWAAQVLEIPLKWKEEMDKQRAHIAATMGDSPKKARPKFHSEYSPLLELYFHFNAYPTYADRRVLAQKTGMLMRQITVWFQNHRRRAKTLLPRMPPTAKIPMEEFEREREKMARKMLPILLPPHLQHLGLGNAKTPEPTPKTLPIPKGAKNAKQNPNPKATKKASEKVPRAGPSTFPGSMTSAEVQTIPTPLKKTKKSKKETKTPSTTVPDIEMTDATAPKEKRRKMKKLPRSAGSAPQSVPMDVDGRSEKMKMSKKAVTNTFDAAAERAFARAAYPAPSKYAYVHTRKPSARSEQQPSPLGKGRPTANASRSTVPARRVSSRLNAMRPPYAFPAPYDNTSVPMTFAAAQTHKFSFVSDSHSFGFKARSSSKPTARHVSVEDLVHKFDCMRLLCAETSAPRSITFSSFEQARLLACAAPLDSAVVDLPRALRLRQPVVQPDAFAPFVALAEKRARRKERKEKKRQEEKHAKKAEKERKKAGLTGRSPLSMDVDDTSSRASSTGSSSRTPSVASSGRTPSLSSVSSRRSSGMSMPDTPRQEQDLPIMATSDFALGGEHDITVTPNMMAQLFGDDVQEDNTLVFDPSMQHDGLALDMLSFTNSTTGALNDMTADVNMPDINGFCASQHSFDDMNWAANLGLDAQDSSAFGSFDGVSDVSNSDLTWLLGQGLHDQTTNWQDASFTTPPSGSSHVDALGETYSYKLGGDDSMDAPLSFNGLNFGFDASDGFTGFGTANFGNASLMT
ncbi:mating type protein A alpha Y mating type dependent binding region-domain-containing protein [Schizophyllum amplum]|uniref:Mating type protein A alpha Y mating type dependent binding region-domain-containing protein n=1 Tax=Schizophyllum amplum TaxID=97359 RepID=A0A550CMT0_9AGAR|nr:mating type protein A alpha Y mating type dependent binding region-domain-containing protein [Auriculariopsis ampla]